MSERFARGAREDECVAHDEKTQLCLGRGLNEFLAESGVELAKLEWIFFFVLRGQAEAGAPLFTKLLEASAYRLFNPPPPKKKNSPN